MAMPVVKSPDAFRTISEVSDALELEPHVLRFWESKFAQIKPVKRSGGRRYYRSSDVALLGGIKFLLREQGMTIKGAQRVLRDRGIRYVSALAEGGDLHLVAGDVDEATGAEVVLLDGRRADRSAPPPPAEPDETDDLPVSMSDQPPHAEGGPVLEAGDNAEAEGVNQGPESEVEAGPDHADAAPDAAREPAPSAARDGAPRDGAPLSGAAPIPLPAALLEDVADDTRLRVARRRLRVDPDRVHANRGAVRRQLSRLRDLRARMDAQSA